MNEVRMIGLAPEELAWVRLLVALLRHEDPVIRELSRQAVLYLEQVASRSGGSKELQAQTGR